MSDKTRSDFEKPSHEQMMAGYKVACRFGVYEAEAFKLAEQMYRAMVGSAALSAPLTAEQRNRWRKCEFCGCNTNAAARACCNKGRQADAALSAGGEQEGRNG